MEDVGDKYFNILLSRSLFQDVVKDKRGRTIYCKMHDFIHDVACAISRDGRRTFDYSDKAARKLHMLTFNSRVFHHEIANCIYLRVLIADSYVITELPNSIAELKHLRYIDISNSLIRKLPESLVLLYNLQTLRLGRFIKFLPNDLRKLISLRHLEFYTDRSNQFKQMPQHLGRLIQLQTLSSFVVGLHEGHKIEELGFLKNLKGKLSLLCLERVKNKKEATAAKLVEKEHIYHLDFLWGWKSEREEGRSYNDLDVLEGLQPHENLQALRIQNFAGELLPSRIFVENLVEIYLQDCERCETLPMFGQLSKLEVLEIRNLPSVRRIGDEFCGNYCKDRTLFPELKTFHIFEMKSLEHWEEIASISNGTMFPHLQSLSIICCVNLMNIPNIFASCWKKLDVDVNSASFSSFQGHGKLRSLKILGCEKLTKLPDGLEFCSSLENLWISDCSNLNLQNMHSLSCLSIRDFQKLPNGIASLLNLKDLSIHGDLQGYDWNPLIHLRSLESLALANSAIGAVQLPQQLGCLTALRSLHISHFDEVTLPEWFRNFTSLEMLKLYNCRNLKNLPSQKALSNLVRLSSLRVYGCSQLELGNGCFQLVKTSNGSIQFLHEIHAPFYW